MYDEFLPLPTFFFNTVSRGIVYLPPQITFPFFTQKTIFLKSCLDSGVKVLLMFFLLSYIPLANANMGYNKYYNVKSELSRHSIVIA